MSHSLAFFCCCFCLFVCMTWISPVYHSGYRPKYVPFHSRSFIVQFLSLQSGWLLARSALLNSAQISPVSCPGFSYGCMRMNTLLSDHRSLCAKADLEWTLWMTTVVYCSMVKAASNPFCFKVALYTINFTKVWITHLHIFNYIVFPLENVYYIALGRRSIIKT